MSVRKRLLGYVWPYKGLIITSALCGLVIVWADLYVAHLARNFTNAAAAEKLTIDQLHRIALFYILLHIPRGICLFWQNYWMAKTTNKIATDLRNEIYSHIQRLSLSFFEKNKTGHLMSRVTYDVGLVQNASGLLVATLTKPLMVIGGVAMMFYTSWKLALVVLVFVPVLSYIVNRVGRRIRKLTAGLQLKLADITAVLEETIAGVRIVKSFVMEGHEIKRFRQQNEASLSYALRSAKKGAALDPVVEMITAIGVAAIILVGGMLVSNGELTMGDFIYFACVGFFVSGAARALAKMVMIYQQMLAAVDRIFEVLDEQPELEDKPEARELSRLEGSVEFRNVKFAYNHESALVLDDISFTINSGEIVAVVGPSGAGKSTIANLIPRFYDVADGAVLVDGWDVRDVAYKSLRKQIGIVPQETLLFAGTIRENIAYGKIDASEEEIIAAAKAANAHVFINVLPEGYSTVIGERGVRLLGGERQRIAIARALLKDPRILILDEATSSLDADSEKVVQEALEVLMQGRSTLIIAHRLSTITKADKILVLADGKIVESGTFGELVKQEGLFAQLYKTQFSGGKQSETCEVTR